VRQSPPVSKQPAQPAALVSWGVAGNLKLPLRKGKAGDARPRIIASSSTPYAACR
jgi:hypothetical protein